MARVARGVLIVVSVLNAVAGMVCGVLFIVSPDGSLMGFEPLIDVVRTLPLADVFFQDLLWIGIAMLLALGLPNLVASVMLLRRSPGQYRVTLLAAVLLVLWCGFELLFMFNVAAVVYLMIGLVCAAASLRLQANT